MLPWPLNIADHDLHASALVACPLAAHKGHDLRPSVLDEQLAVCNTPQLLAPEDLIQRHRHHDVKGAHRCCLTDVEYDIPLSLAGKRLVYLHAAMHHPHICAA